MSGTARSGDHRLDAGYEVDPDGLTAMGNQSRDALSTDLDDRMHGPAMRGF
jgi:hypothetical protein